MTEGLVVVLLVAVAFAVHEAWARFERRRGGRAAEVARDVAALGDDAAPKSIHPDISHACIGSGACVRACPEKDVIAVVDGRAELVNPLACIGHGACMAACPVDAITLVFGTARRGVELPRLDEEFQTNQPGVYVAGELGGMGLIRNAVEQGRQVAAAIVASGRRGGAAALDALVVGAGPAGISATLALREAGLRVHLVDQEEFGGTIRHYPRAKVVMTGAIDLPGYGRVKQRTMSKEDLLRLWDDVRTRTNLDVETGVRVDGLWPGQGGVWEIRAGDWRRHAASIVLALGRRGTPRRLGVPGEELAKVSYRLLEPEPFAGQRVLVVGGGNAAAECALALADAGTCASLALSYRRPELARLRAQVRARLDRAVAQQRVRALMPTNVVAIGERDVTLRGPTGEQRLANDAVIVQIGGTAPDALLQSFGIDVVEKRGEA